MIDRSLFAVHFEQLKEINSHTLNFYESFAFGNLNYLSGNSKKKTKLIKKGLRVIPQTRAQLAKSMGWSIGKTNNVLEKLKNHKLIQIVIGTWYRAKRSFFAVKDGINFKPNMMKIKFLKKFTGGNKETVMYLKFLYESNIGVACGHGKDWVRVAFSEFKALLTCSFTTCNKIRKKLVDKGLLECEGGHGGGEMQYYARINKQKYDQILSEWVEEDRKYRAEIEAKTEAKKRTEKTDFVLSYNNRDLETRSTINNNIEDIDIIQNNGDIVTLKDSTYTLSERDWRYAKAALEKTILNAKIEIQNHKNLWNELKFALKTPGHTQRMNSFKHAINSFMFLIRFGLWRQPLGYHKYSDECKKGYDHIREVEANHYSLKSGAALSNLQARGELPPEIKINATAPAELDLEPSLGEIEYFAPQLKKQSSRAQDIFSNMSIFAQLKSLECLT